MSYIRDRLEEKENVESSEIIEMRYKGDMIEKAKIMNVKRQIFKHHRVSSVDNEIYRNIVMNPQRGRNHNLEIPNLEIPLHSRLLNFKEKSLNLNKNFSCNNFKNNSKIKGNMTDKTSNENSFLKDENVLNYVDSSNQRPEKNNCTFNNKIPLLSPPLMKSINLMTPFQKMIYLNGKKKEEIQRRINQKLQSINFIESPNISLIQIKSNRRNVSNEDIKDKINSTNKSMKRILIQENKNTKMKFNSVFSHTVKEGKRNDELKIKEKNMNSRNLIEDNLNSFEIVIKNLNKKENTESRVKTKRERNYSLDLKNKCNNFSNFVKSDKLPVILEAKNNNKVVQI